MPKGTVRRLRVPTGSLRAGDVTLGEEQAHYVRDVLRLRPGDALELFDGAGWVVTAQVLEGATVRVLELPVGRPEPGPRLTVAVASPKGERADWLVEKLTELGVSTLQWVLCARSVVVPGEGRQRRHVRLAEAAARQAGRTYVPTILSPTSLHTFLTPGDNGPTTIDRGEGDGAPGASRAEAPGREPCQRFIAQPGGASLTGARRCAGHDIVLLVGPEGGFTPEELQHATDAGYTAASLSHHILRVETAAVAGAALLLAPSSEPA